VKLSPQATSAGGCGACLVSQLAACSIVPRAAQRRWPGNTNTSNRVDRSGNHHAREIAHANVPLLVFPLFSLLCHRGRFSGRDSSTA
jgi:hypothetical protein